MTTELVKTDELQQEVAPVVARANELVIVTPQDYEGAAAFLKTIKSASKKVDEFFDGMIDSAHKTWKQALAQKATFADPLKKAETTTKQKQLYWQQEQERIRLETERKLQAAADEKARRDREALEKKAASMKTPEKQEEYRQAAAAVQAPVVTVASVVPEVKGQSIRKTWCAVVVDADQVPREWMMVNDQALQAFARSTKGAVQVAGVRFEERSTLASASK